jgi:hypothetical protein
MGLFAKGEGIVKTQDQMDESGPSPLSGEPAPTRLRDIGRLLAFAWACCSLLYFAALTSEVLAMNSGVPAVPFFLSYAGIPILIPWATVFIAWRWQTIGALMLVAWGLPYAVEAYRMAGVLMTAMCSVLPALLGLLPIAAGALLLAARLTRLNDVPHER